MVDRSDNKKCIVLVPVQHHIEPECDVALRALEHQGYDVWRADGFSAIDQGRNIMAQTAMDKGYDELMWVDSDVAFNASDVTRLRNLNLPISCGIYGMKDGSGRPMADFQGKKEIGKNLVEITSAGFGFMHTRRSVYQKIVETLKLKSCNGRQNRYYPFFIPLIYNDCYLGEDFAFCHQARQAGFKITADTSIKLKHVGKIGYVWKEGLGGDEPEASPANPPATLVEPASLKETAANRPLKAVVPHSLLVVLPYSQADAGAMADMLKWVVEMNNCKQFDCLLVEDSAVRAADAAGVRQAAKDAFNTVNLLVTHGLENLKWPAASTAMFIQAARWIHAHPARPFFWCEADCIPVRKTWLQELEYGYSLCHQEFMGCLVDLADGKLNKHLTGCAVYPHDAIQYVQQFEASALRGDWIAWDLASAETMVPKTANTEMVQHSWGLWKEPPTFVKERQWFEPTYVRTLNSISPSAVVFHRCKDGSLVRLLRDAAQK